MRPEHARWLVAAILAMAPRQGLPLCQEATGAAGQDMAEGGQAAPTWEYYASAYAYFVPDDDNYLVPIIYADRDRLHLEARYNYEAADTGSIFAGWNFSAGESFTFEATAMLAAIFGDVGGIAPAYRVAIEYKSFDAYSEGEYVIDVGDSDGSYLYFWSEAAYSPLGWLRLGVVGQRTRLYETELEIQRGLLAGYSHEPFDFTVYYLNPDQDDPTIVLAASVSF